VVPMPVTRKSGDTRSSQMRSALPLATATVATLAIGALPDVSVAAGSLPAHSDSSQKTVVYRSNADDFEYKDDFTRKFYAGFGLGRSWLEPDTSELEGVGPNDRVQLGMQFTLGMDLKRWLSLEAQLTELGDAGLSNGGTIGYRELGASALLYFGGARDRYNRRGFSGFGRVGLGLLQNEPSDNVNTEQVNSASYVLGLGAEYAMRNGLALRAEGIVFDADVNYMQVGLMYRFGKRRERRREVLVEAPVENLCCGGY